MTSPVQILTATQAPAAATPASAAGAAFASLLSALSPVAAAGAVFPGTVPPAATPAPTATDPATPVPGPAGAAALTLATLPAADEAQAVGQPGPKLALTAKSSGPRIAGQAEHTARRVAHGQQQAAADPVAASPGVATPSLPLVSNLLPERSVTTAFLTLGSAAAESAASAGPAAPASIQALAGSPAVAMLQQPEIGALLTLPVSAGDAGGHPVASEDSLAVAPSGPGNPAAAPVAAQGPAQPPPAAATSEVPAATPVSPARQLSPALVQLAHGTSGNTVTVQLDPAGLGHVQVRIDRDANGAATIQVTAERPETLRLLVADQPHLHQALDSAGVASDGRSLNFALSAQTGGAFGGADSGGTGGRPSGGRNGRPSSRSNGSDDEASFTSQSAWLRAGVDITA